MGIFLGDLSIGETCMDGPAVLEMVQTAAGTLWMCVLINNSFLSVIVSFHILAGWEMYEKKFSLSNYSTLVTLLRRMYHACKTLLLFLIGIMFCSSLFVNSMGILYFKRNISGSYCHGFFQAYVEASPLYCLPRSWQINILESHWHHAQSKQRVYLRSAPC